MSALRGKADKTSRFHSRSKGEIGDKDVAFWQQRSSKCGASQSYPSPRLGIPH
jgi:hypothetical protein